MLSIKPLPEFTAWLDELANWPILWCAASWWPQYCGSNVVSWVMLNPLVKVSLSCAYMLAQAGACMRLQSTQRGLQLIVLLAGGSKRTQQRDIKRAKTMAALLD